MIIYPVVHIVFKRHYLTANVIKVCAIAFISVLSLGIFWSRLTPPLIYIGLITAAGSAREEYWGTDDHRSSWKDDYPRIF